MKLRGIRMIAGDGSDQFLLRDSDVPDLALLHHFFELLPGWVRVFGQLDIELSIFTEGDRPTEIFSRFSGSM